MTTLSSKRLQGCKLSHEAIEQTLILSIWEGAWEQFSLQATSKNCEWLRGLLCRRFIQNSVYQILSELIKFLFEAMTEHFGSAYFLSGQAVYIADADLEAPYPSSAPLSRHPRFGSYKPIFCDSDSHNSTVLWLCICCVWCRRNERW